MNYLLIRKSAMICSALSVSMVLGYLGYQHRFAFLTVINTSPHNLCSLIRDNNITALHEYLDHGGSINIPVRMKDEIGIIPGSEDGTLLHCAIEFKNTEIVIDLLRRGANSNIQSVETTYNMDNGVHKTTLTPWERANKDCVNSELIKHYLLEHGAKH